MKNLYSKIGTTKSCKYFFYGIKIKMIFLVVFNNEKMFAQMFGICIFKVGLLKWLMEI